jgi:hypothetical protein
MNKFETKKKLLVAESEVYRQLLKLELQTFKVYGTRAKRRMSSVSTYLPAIMTALPFAKALFAGKRGRVGRSSGFSLKSMVSLLMAGWKTYQRFGPFFGRNRFGRADGQPTKTAAEEYLSKRL